MFMSDWTSAAYRILDEKHVSRRLFVMRRTGLVPSYAMRRSFLD